MNFLQMVQRLHSEAGRQGTTPATVLSQTGMNSRLVAWIQSAYEDIQNLYQTWLFLVDDFSFSTVSGTANYTPAVAGITDLQSWKFNPNHDCLSGIRLYSAEADETDLIYCPWDEYRTIYKFGAHRSATDRPSVFSIKPDKSMELWANPNAVFTVNGEYIKQAHTLSANADVPLFDDYHMVIVWRALMLYGAFEGANDAYTHGQNEYEDLLAKLIVDQLPKITWGPPLA